MCADAELVTRACAGDRAAFATLCERYGERVRRYAVAMVAEPAAAEDLAQECLRRAQEGLAGLREPARFTSWLFAIAVNLCREHLRKAGRDGACLDELDAEVAERRRGALSSVMRRESAELLALAIDRLPVLLREAFVLRHVEGMAYEEMERVAGASAGTLQVRAHRARGLLRQQLGPVVDTYWSERS